MPRRKIGADEGGANGAGTWPELLLMWRLAWPSGVATVLRSGTRQTTMIVVGHMGTRELGGVALGTAWVSMMGMSLVFGGFSGLDTFASQSFGAKNCTLRPPTCSHVAARRPSQPRVGVQTLWSGSGRSGWWSSSAPS